MDYQSSSAAAILRELGARFRAYRITANKTQKEVAEWAGVSVITVHNFESGKSTSIDFRVLVSLLKSIGRAPAIDGLIPDLTISPYVQGGTAGARRVRHKSSEL